MNILETIKKIVDPDLDNTLVGYRESEEKREITFVVAFISKNMLVDLCNILNSNYINLRSGRLGYGRGGIEVTIEEVDFAAVSS